MPISLINFKKSFDFWRDFVLKILKSSFRNYVKVINSNKSDKKYLLALEKYLDTCSLYDIFKTRIHFFYLKKPNYKMSLL